MLSIESLEMSDDARRDISQFFEKYIQRYKIEIDLNTFITVDKFLNISYIALSPVISTVSILIHFTWSTFVSTVSPVVGRPKDLNSFPPFPGFYSIDAH